MSFEAKLIFTGCVLAVILPMMVVVVRRIVRGELFKKSGRLNRMTMPPPGPSIDVDGGGP